MNQQNLYFIIGIDRSGTTLLQEIMNTFSEFCNTKESRLHSDNDPLFAQSCYYYVRLNNDFSYLENFIFDNWTRKNFVEKTPDSILCLKQLAKQFPLANYIFLERNPVSILLSQLNMFNTKNKQIKKMIFDVENLCMKKSDMDNLIFSQFLSKRILKEIKLQISYKKLFKKQITIRYESLIDGLESILNHIATSFNITSNLREAEKVFANPSSSSVHNTYNITEIDDYYTLIDIKTSQLLWDYEYEFKK